VAEVEFYAGPRQVEKNMSISDDAPPGPRPCPCPCPCPCAERFRPHVHANTAAFTFAAANPWVRVVGGHDGDTLTAIVEAFPDAFVRTNVRLSGIDACEMSSRDAELRRRAVAARDRLLHMVTRLPELPPAASGERATKRRIDAMLEGDVHMVYADFSGGMDKYGRALAYLRASPDDATTFNQTLLDEGLALPYDGGHKTPFAVAQAQDVVTDRLRQVLTLQEPTWSA
jgi:endonuclease YncB( thermonuclease family)